MIIKNLKLSFDNQKIFDNVNLILNKTDHIGLVGLNGAGKTTFFRLLLGEIVPDSGQILLDKNTRISFLPQVIDEDLDNKDITVFEYLLLGRPLEKLEKELINLYNEVATASLKEQSKIFKKISNTQSLLDYYDVYEAEAILLKIIEGMNIDNNLLDKKIKELSGGQKSKVAFARLLYSKPEIILLDEPTNHLDLETKEYVISYLRKYNGMVIVISHDDEFLDLIANKIVFLDKRIHNMTIYDGNYSSFKRHQIEDEIRIKNEAMIQEKEEKRLREIVLKYSNSSGNRKKMAQDREKKLQKLLENKIELPKETKQVKLKFISPVDSANMPLKVSNISFSYVDGVDVIKDLSFAVYRNEKFLVVGLNGVGKTTLLKIINNILRPYTGAITLSSKTKIGYYAQEHEGLEHDKTILENFKEFNINQKELRSILGNFLFTDDDIYKKINVLSPGERSRVALAKLMLQKSNLLLLDEPTNHLDLETQKIIAETLKNYDGTMIVVSHNPVFVDNIGINRMLVLPEGKIEYYSKEKVEYYNIKNRK